MIHRKYISLLFSALFIPVFTLILAFNPQYGAFAQAPAILYVIPGGTGNCSTWATACTLTAALNRAVSGDEIWVAGGVHRPTSDPNRSATFQLKSGVAVYGGFAGTETARDQRNPTTHVTTLSGDLLGNDVGFTNNAENVYHVVMGANSAILDGFTITGGNANGTVVPDDAGGGMFIYQRNPSLTNLTFSYNTASSLGGGLYIDNGSPTLTDVAFTNNTATWGGGMNGYASSPQLNRVTFSNNAAQSAGGGLVLWSGGSATLTNVTFFGNSATENGGGIVIEGESSATLSNVTFVGNSAYRGGGIHNSTTALSLRNTLFWNNTATSAGAQVYNNGSISAVNDSVFQDGCPAGSTCTNVITADPLLGSIGNYGGVTQTIPLLLGSSAIDAGNDAFCPLTDQRGITRPQGVHCDIGAYEFVNLAPTDILLSDNTVAENAAINTPVGTLSSVDPDPDNTFTYSLVSGDGGADNASFNISVDTLRTSAIFDLESRSNYSVRIRATDQGGLWYEEAFMISVTNVNETPTDILLSNNTVAENAAIDTPVGTLSSTDPDPGNTFTYSLVSGSGDTDNTSFNISGNALRTSAVFDYETRFSYSVRVRSTDQGGLWVEEAFTITIINGNEFPTDIQLSQNTVAENAAINTIVGNLSSTDPDPGNTFTYNLASGSGDTDNAAFNISGNALRTSLVFDFETRSSYSVRIRSTDQGDLWVEKAFIITVTDVNDIPTNIVLSNSMVAENAAVDTLVGNLSSVDPDPGNTFTYSLVSGPGDANNASFHISGETLRTAAVFNFETQASYSVRIRTTDQGGLWYEETFTITVTNVNESPTDILLSTATLAEGVAMGTTVGTLTSADPDLGNTFSYSLVSGSGDTGNAAFIISGDALRTAAIFDFETQASYSVRIRTTDQGGLGFEEAFVITVTDVNESPTDILLSNNTAVENAAINTPVGTLSSADADAGNTFSYSLVSGTGSADNTFFNLSGDVLYTAAVFDFETRSSYSIRIRTTDQGNLEYEEVFTIAITDANDAPVLAWIPDATLDEMEAFSFTASAADADTGAVLTFSLSGTIPAGAAINSTGGTFAWTPTEAQGPAAYAFIVQVCDNGAPSLCDQQEITLTVREANIAPAAENDAYSVGLNQTLSVLAPGVLSNDWDADLPPNDLSVNKLTDPAHGTLTLNEDGSFTYTPTPNWYGVDSFTYQTYDGLLYSPPATVTLTVRPITLFIPIVFR